MPKFVEKSNSKRLIIRSICATKLVPFYFWVVSNHIVLFMAYFFKVKTWLLLAPLVFWRDHIPFYNYKRCVATRRNAWKLISLPRTVTVDDVTMGDLSKLKRAYTDLILLCILHQASVSNYLLMANTNYGHNLLLKREFFPCIK